eukprot:CAMPEP_0113687978 /NCGR_PEP_ID=MMETSP0038_2-20120614/16257_1 /TAXON_ID=2898 /ORGANISM="Cryptomonas paramecium" /LENGTH=148 /DNA_ID=CAMNT_0000608695 /DNA_START=172 /DNA_END=614 /DNA_ORIENTATION=+ /assembly_acc=CAM_ASM_000170
MRNNLAWPRSSSFRGQSAQSQTQQSQQLTSAYDYDEADNMTGGWGSQQSQLYNGWMMADACKIKDALFIGNLLAVQDISFVTTNKIQYCIKCQTGFPAPPHLKRAGMTCSVMNLLGAFTDPTLPADRKDSLLENFFQTMEEASEQGVG